MTLRIGINGFGRIGRLALRSLWPYREKASLEIVRINDPGGSTETFAHLLEFDSVHGHWAPGAGITAGNEAITVDGITIPFSGNRVLADSDWAQCDVVIEASGVMKTAD
ncbi:hypothetical protein GCM10007159_40510 [Modicisalibacter luteus]|nr:hypothetical protein GCM10007159_40510 [Halomonas lutea]